MLISITDLKNIYTDLDFSKYSDIRLEMKLSSIESTIRNLTHNNFHNRSFRFVCPSENRCLYCSESSFFNVGDTLEITGSKYNNGLYSITNIQDNVMTLDKPLLNGVYNVVTKVEYPIDIIDGAVNLLEWEINQKPQLKQGVTSETISRHSVSYKQYDESNMLEGYPSEMWSFIKKYTDWRT